MVTKTDLNIIAEYVDGPDHTTWAHVDYKGDRYILTATNVTDDMLGQIMDENPGFGLMFLFGLPRFECAVFHGDENWTIVGECNDECANGVCTKRIAQAKPDVPTIEDSYRLLLNYLNS